MNQQEKHIQETGEENPHIQTRDFLITFDLEHASREL